MTPIVMEPVGDGNGAFATALDVETRLGRELTAAEAGSVDLLLTLATATIANAADKSEEWAAALDPVPVLLKGFCIELTCRALANPEGLFATSETLGKYSTSKSFNRDTASAMALSEIERKVIRRAVRGTIYEVRTPTATETLLEELLVSEGS